ncbi:MAG TPA: hypothetical protein VN259_14800 [Xanthomonadales bacterium]|nr:hypothetical protein [Xanthomonadales bacterium]
MAQLYGGVGANWTRGIDRLYRRRRGPAFDLWIVLTSLAVNVLGKTRVRQWLRARSTQRAPGGQAGCGE